MARGSTLNISLTSTLDSYVRNKVASGEYESASEVIRESLRVSRAVEEKIFWSQARAKVALRRKQVAQGKWVDGPTEMDRLINELSSDRPSRKAKRR